MIRLAETSSYKMKERGSGRKRRINSTRRSTTLTD
jgi:hypothetical protein